MRLCIPSLLLRFISTLPGYDDYKRMVNDDECAVCVFVCICVCECICVYASVFLSFSLKTLVSSRFIGIFDGFPFDLEKVVDIVGFRRIT